MELLEYFAEQRGRLSRVARAAGVPPGYLSQVAAGTKVLRPAYVPAVEAACELKVRRWNLRKDDWHQIWPDLIGTPGAPPVPPAAANDTAEERRHAA